jgi:hypothetical protein
METPGTFAKHFFIRNGDAWLSVGHLIVNGKRGSLFLCGFLGYGGAWYFFNFYFYLLFVGLFPSTSGSLAGFRFSLQAPRCL